MELKVPVIYGTIIHRTANKRVWYRGAAGLQGHRKHNRTYTHTSRLVRTTRGQEGFTLAGRGLLADIAIGRERRRALPQWWGIISPRKSLSGSFKRFKVFPSNFNAH